MRPEATTDDGEPDDGEPDDPIPEDRPRPANESTLQSEEQWPTDHGADPVIAERWGIDASMWPY